MKIYEKLVFQWNDETGSYIKVAEVSKEYDGPVAQLCGATDSQKQIQQQQQSFSQQLVSQASAVFGNASKVFNDLVNTFSPTIAAGPNQEGFSAAEKANLQSTAITSTGQAYRNARQAVGEAQAAQGGGNTPGVTSGAKVGTDLSLAENAANQTSSELSQIEQADYNQGRQNYDFAVEGLSKAPDVFNPATGADNAATGSQEGAANTANQIAQENNSWVQAVTGALGGVAGAATGGFMRNLGSGTKATGVSGALPTVSGPLSTANA